MLDHGGPDGRVSTGVPALDRALGGLYWGESVAWELDGASAGPFYRAILGPDHPFDAIRWIAVNGRPSRPVADLPQLEAVGTYLGRAAVEPVDLLREIRTRCDPGRRNLLLFESLDAMVDAWGAELTRGFVARCCPLLLEAGAVAYWSTDGRTLPATVRGTVEAASQCVLRVDRHGVLVVKAEGRDPGVSGSLLRWHDGQEGRGPGLSEADVAGRVAASLRAVRQARHISQRQLGEMAGVTASAVSQAERAERGLSLSTLVRLSSNLELKLDDLLQGDDSSAYRIGRRLGDPRGGHERAATLLGGIASDVSVDLVHLRAREAGVPIAHQGGEGIVAVSRGLVQVEVGDQTPAIREGEVLVAECARVHGWRNLGDREAVLFWFVIDRRA